MPARQLLHALYRGPVGDRLGEIVPARLLLRAKIRAVKNLLEARDLRPGLSGLRDVGFVFLHHRSLHFFKRALDRCDVRRLNQ